MRPPPLDSATARGSSRGDVAGPVVLHEYPTALRGRLVRRYKRFLADVLLGEGPEGAGGEPPGTAEAGGSDGSGASGGGGAAAAGAATGRSAGMDGEAPQAEAAAAVTTCHCPNTGPMTGLLDWPLAPVVLSVSSAPGRKYAHGLEMIQSCPGGAWVGVHSALANRLVGALLEGRRLPQLGEYGEVAREVPLGSHGSRVDFMLTRPNGRRVYVEVKSVTLAEPYQASTTQPTAEAGEAVATAAAPGEPAAAASHTAADPGAPRIALFPDTVSERAQRHVGDLMDAVKGGHEAACVFAIQRSDCGRFAPCVAADPAYAALVRQAAAAGVQVLALRLDLQPPGAEPGAAPGEDAGGGERGGAGGGGEEAQGAQARRACISYLGPAEVVLGYGGEGAGGEKAAGGRGKRGGRGGRGAGRAAGRAAGGEGAGGETGGGPRGRGAGSGGGKKRKR
ncbi:hypothetical protein HYH03_001331 [Edaphochlamys debaryana]|uniref:Sugar fermentation stimulation protein C-terminal domain-containing protein n=1 Tax=Edaphochlamys debaryana TaxID=47281 RepID=A0A836C564_9CHLO|nr:hypothetical protein HYH03_001331 [Edaphochlamys debaryana]|eukprot:KAG2500560.1 hypothetical protein HYH03_001331 [Edaphochlamys debaryana]